MAHLFPAHGVRGAPSVVLGVCSYIICSILRDLSSSSSVSRKRGSEYVFIVIDKNCWQVPQQAKWPSMFLIVRLMAAEVGVSASCGEVSSW
jgi:hypothetical protein